MNTYDVSNLNCFEFKALPDFLIEPIHEVIGRVELIWEVVFVSL
jgi:hypothetical protein